MNELNANRQPHGLWRDHYLNGELSWKGNFVNGKLHGLYESYYRVGNLCAKGFYLNGQKIGFWLKGWSSGEIEKRFYL